MESQAPTHTEQDNTNLTTTEQYENRYQLLDKCGSFDLMEVLICDSEFDEEYTKEEFKADIIHNMVIQLNKPDWKSNPESSVTCLSASIAEIRSVFDELLFLAPYELGEEHIVLREQCIKLLVDGYDMLEEVKNYMKTDEYNDAVFRRENPFA